MSPAVGNAVLVLAEAEARTGDKEADAIMGEGAGDGEPGVRS